MITSAYRGREGLEGPKCDYIIFEWSLTINTIFPNNIVFSQRILHKMKTSFYYLFRLKSISFTFNKLFLRFVIKFNMVRREGTLIALVLISYHPTP